MEDIQKAIERVRLVGKYTYILDQLEKSTSPNWPFVFELLFVDQFILHGLYLEYEKNVNRSNDKTVDFIYQAETNDRFLFELVRPEMSETLQSEHEQNLYRDGIRFSSKDKNKFLRPEAQTIRLQEKLLEKVEKFPEPDDKNFSVIVVDCSNFHFGHFDDEDARMCMYGKTKNLAFLEIWNGKRISGLLEQGQKILRNAPEFQRKVTAVIFIPRLQVRKVFAEAKVVFNSLRSENHKMLFQHISINLQPFNNTKWL